MHEPAWALRRPPRADGRLVVTMVFCGKTVLRHAFCRATGLCESITLLSSVTGSAAVAAPGDAAFRSLIANLTRQLIPDQGGGLQTRF